MSERRMSSAEAIRLAGRLERRSPDFLHSRGLPVWLRPLVHADDVTPVADVRARATATLARGLGAGAGAQAKRDHERGGNSRAHRHAFRSTPSEDSTTTTR